MKRLLLLGVALAALVTFAPGPAAATTPCRDRIYSDWYPDGRIATTYPIACYRDALKHIRPDALTYSSLADDIRSAMQAALARLHHQHVPAEVGKGTPPQTGTTDTSVPPKSTDSQSSGPQPVSQTVPVTTTLAASPTSSSGGGIPVPLLVLGGLALVLVAVGALGVVAKRTRG